MSRSRAARNRHQEFLAFLRQLTRRFPTREVHLVLDNYSPHKHHKVKTWQEAHPRFHFHFIPTCSSWLNRVEAWSGALQRQVMDRGSFDDVAALQATLGCYVRGYTRRATPPQWRPPPTPSWPGSHRSAELTKRCTSTDCYHTAIFLQGGIP